MTARWWLRSFQARSIAAALAGCLLTWGGWSLWAWYEASQDRNQLDDEELRHAAQDVLLAFPRALATHPDAANFELPKDAPAPEAGREFNYQVWSRDRRLVSRAATTPKVPLNPRFDTGFSTIRIGDVPWRVYSLIDAQGEIHVQVGSNPAQRKAAAALEAREGLWGLVILVPSLTLCLVAVGLWTSHPLRKLRNSVAKRQASDHATLPAAGLPSEVVPLVNTFNELLDRAAQAREAQKRFVGDAAHELRTPLTAIRLQAQIALRARDEAKREAALMRLIDGVDRASRATAQLLDMASMESLEIEARPVHDQPADLQAIVATTVDGMEGLAKRRRIRLRADIEPLWVNGDAELLGIALRNVLDNAMRYSPPDTVVDIVARWHEDVAWLSVIDAGPGLSDEQKTQAMKAFVRLNPGDEFGSGLGLSIVQRISALLRIDFALLDAPSGTGLEARFTLVLLSPTS